LSEIFYGGRQFYAQEGNTITGSNTAWSIAGEDFDSETTVYRLPNGQSYTGDQIADTVGWNRIPPKTVVLLNQEDSSGL
ncbi:MAG: N-acetylmuramoyl-L-alanine amidase, partial [Phycisphaerae bacterium]|nr:N-acetylmuramoyl-L-alanine amidase [Phycisphaerae bacterium]NIX26950.1 N-acetylmuramoyl-L-alanine amidase [Phycisphaerae bacterium]